MTNPLLTSILHLCAKAKNVMRTQVRNLYQCWKKAIKLTQDEHCTKQAIQDMNKIVLTTALEEACKSIMELAENLTQQFPGHDSEYYYKVIMQLPVKKSKCMISQWCVYLSIRMEQHNEGM